MAVMEEHHELLASPRAQSPKFLNATPEAVTVASTPCGVPVTKPRITLSDASVIVAQLLCSVLMFISVFYTNIAVWLGQINQLIVIGFLLGISNLLFTGMVTKTSVIVAGRLTSTAIQDLDALMRYSFWASSTLWSVRLLLFVLFALPLGLSAAYKTFTGGKQLVGKGVAICTDIYLDFWIRPAIGTTYGHALFIPDNDTAVIVDAPLSAYVQTLQSDLASVGDIEQVLSLKVNVNSTVARVVNPSPEQRADLSYWDNLAKQTPISPITFEYEDGAWSGFWPGLRLSTDQDNVTWPANFSVMWFSSWNTTRNETFESEATRVELTRGDAMAEWRITPSNITLANATLLNPKNAYQDIIASNMLHIEKIYGSLIGEFDWHNRANSFHYPYPLSTPDHPQWYQPVNTIPAFASAIVWSRITSLNGPDRTRNFLGGVGADAAAYSIAPENIETKRTTTTLKRSPWLVVVLLIYPVLNLICFAIKFFLYSVPIGDNFNYIALLAASKDAGLRILEGAALSGNLNRRVPVAFTVDESELLGNDTGQIRVLLDSQARRRQGLKKATIYS